MHIPLGEHVNIIHVTQIIQTSHQMIYLEKKRVQIMQMIQVPPG